MARVFGRGATYNSLEGQFRKYREVARRLASDAQGGNGNISQAAKSTTPRTPRSKTNGVQKPGSGKKATAAAKDKIAQFEKSITQEALDIALCCSSTDSDGDLTSIDGGSPVKKEEILEDNKCIIDSQVRNYAQVPKDENIFEEDA